MVMRSLTLSFCLVLAVAFAGTGCSREAVPLAAPGAATPAQTGRTVRAALSSTAYATTASSSPTALCKPVADPNRAQCMGIGLFASAWGASSAPAGGLQPTDIATLYNLQSSDLARSSNQVIGIVVAYHNPNLEADLATYRAFFGLAPCTSASGCLIRTGAANVGASAQATLERPESVSANPTDPDDQGWEAESDADTEAASAACPRCKIVVAEAASNSLADLGTAVGDAVRAGATIVSTSFGTPESPAQTKYESLFEPGGGVKVVAAAGDAPGVFFPAAASNVVAVAGTSLQRVGLLSLETTWSQSGGGCSGVFARPSWQLLGLCSHRNVADIAAVADPATGLAVFSRTLGGWSTMGGTSVSAPLVAGMWALSGDTAALPGAQRLYQRSAFYLNVNTLTSGLIAGLGVPSNLLAF